MPTTVIGLFDDVRDAQEVIETLERDGFNRGDISIVARSVQPPDAEIGVTGDAADTETDAGTDAPADPAAAGAGTGAVLGGTAGIFLGLAALMIPGVGPFLAAGPLAAALAGAGIGAATGGVVGALTNAGVPEETAPHYAEAVQRGAMLVAVTADENLTADIENLMERHNAVNIRERAESWRNSSPDTPAV